MEDKDLAVVLTAFKKQHPEMVSHLRTLTALRGTPAGDSAAVLLPFLLQLFDDHGQILWQFRDLVSHRDVDGKRMYFLRYSDGSMVPRICAAAGLTQHEPIEEHNNG